MKQLLLMSVCLIMVACITVKVIAADRPNFVWILSEDNAMHYQKLFFKNGAPTPNIEKLANHGLIFNHTFSNAPVCSVARSTLATGIYAPRIGTHFHRKSKPVVFPDHWKTYSQLMHAAGYYTTNNSKTDYNFTSKTKLWDESSRKASWRNRKDKKQPFYHMETHTRSHESSLHFTEKQIKPDELITNPKDVKLADYHPDTPLMRFTYARYHDRQIEIDKIVGNTIKKLEQDGLLEDTFVFYFGDHGGVLPRSKGYVYESGLHVPLVVRVPNHFKHLVNIENGTRVDGFVSFIDFGATIMNLAGLKVPKYIDGKPFLGPDISLSDINKRDETFGYADRFDEKYDFVRTLRKGRFKYHRNFQSFYPDGLQNNYRYKMLAYEQWRTLYQQKKLNAVQSQFFEPRAVEALYDIENDPHEVRNLANNPEYKKILHDLRQRLFAKMKQLPDSSLYPENYIVTNMVKDPIGFSKSHRDKIGHLLDTANLALQPFNEVKKKIADALNSNNPWERYWGLTVCSNFGVEAKPLLKEIKSCLSDDHLLNRVRAAEYLGMIGEADPGPVIRKALQESRNDDETLIILNSVVYLQDGTPKLNLNIKKSDIRTIQGQVPRRIEYLIK